MSKQAETISSKDFLRFLNDKFDRLAKGPDGKGLDTTGGTKSDGSTPPTTIPPDTNYKYGIPSAADLKSIADFLASQGIGVTNKSGATPGSSSGFIATEPNTRSLIEYLTQFGAGANVGGGTGFTGAGGGTGAGTGSVIPSTSLGSQPATNVLPLTFNQIQQILNQSWSMNQNANAFGGSSSGGGFNVGGGNIGSGIGSGSGASSSSGVTGGVTFRKRGGRLASEHALKAVNKAIYLSRKK